MKPLFQKFKRLREALKSVALGASPLLLSTIIYHLSTTPCSAQTQLVETNLQMTGSTNDTVLNFLPDNNPIWYNNTIYTLPVGGTNIMSSNGVAQISLVPQGYTLSFQGLPLTYHFYVTNSAQPLNIASLIPPNNGKVIYPGIFQIMGATGIAVSPILNGGIVWITNTASGGGGGGGIGTFSSIILNGMPVLGAATNPPSAFDPSGAALAAFLSGSNFVNASILAAGAVASNYANAVGLNNTNFTLAQIATAGSQATNFTLATALQGSNNTASAIATAGSQATNFTLATALQGSNNTASAVATAGTQWTNFSLAIGGNGSNFTLTIGANGTNESLLIGLNGTNFTIAQVNALGTASTNFTLATALQSTNFTLAQIATLGLQLTNYANGQGGAGAIANLGTQLTNFTLNIGLNNTNFTLSTALQGTNFTLFTAGQSTNFTLAQIATAGTQWTNYSLAIGLNNTNFTIAQVNALGTASTNFTLAQIATAGSQATNFTLATALQGSNNTTSAVALHSNNIVSSLNTSNLILGTGPIAPIAVYTNEIWLIGIGPGTNGTPDETNGVFVQIGSSVMFTNTITGGSISNTTTSFVVRNGSLATLNTGGTQFGVYADSGAGQRVFAIPGWAWLENGGAHYGMRTDTNLLAIIAAQIAAYSNNVTTGFAVSNSPVLNGPVTIISPASQGLILSNASAQVNEFVSTGSPLDEVFFQFTPYVTPGLTIGSNFISSPFLIGNGYQVTHASASNLEAQALGQVTTVANGVGLNDTNFTLATALQGSNFTLATALQGSNNASSLTQAGSNYSAALTQAGSNNTASAIATAGSQATNFTLATALQGSNFTLATALQGSNNSSALTQAGSNYSAALAQANTNFTVNTSNALYPLTTNPPTQFAQNALEVDGSQVLTNDWTNGVYFPSFTGAAAPFVTNGSGFIWTATNLLMNPETGAFITNTLASPITWTLYSNNTFGAIGTWVGNTPLGNYSGSSGSGADTNGLAVNAMLVFNRMPYFPSVPAIIQTAINVAVAASSNGVSLFNPTISASYDTGQAVQTNLIAYTNSMWRNQWFAQQNKGVARAPIRGIASWFGAYTASSWTNTATQTGISNAIAYMRQSLPGYNWVELDDGWGDSNLVNGIYMQCASNLQHTFGAGTNGVFNMITTIASSNVNLILYADGGTNLSSGQFQRSMGGPYLSPNINLWTAWGAAGLKIDMSEIQQEQAASVISSNGYPVYLSGAADGNFDQGGNGPLSRVYPAMFNATRIVSGGDITSYPELMRWMDVSQTNKWNYLVEPGRFIDLDFTGGTYTGSYGANSVKAHLIAIALYSSPQLLSGPLFTGWPWYTNQDLAAIQQDAGVFCAQRFLQVSNCDVYLKPLGTQTGPQWALGVFNRSSTLATNVSFSLNSLTPLALSGVPNWSIFDCISNGTDGSSGRWLTGPTNYITVALNTNDAALFRLVPNVALITNVVAVNYPFSMTVNVVSNGTPMTCYVPIDATSSNYMLAAQLTNNTSSEPFEIAAAQTTALGTAHGWLRNLDILHLYMGGTSNSTAQNFVSQTVGAIAWTSSGVTYGLNSVTGNGSSGYGTTTFNPSAANQNFNTNSALMFSWVKSTSVTSDNFMLGANNGSSLGAGLALRNGTTVFDAYGINAPNGFSLSSSWLADGVTGNCSGWWMAERTSSASEFAYHGANQDASDTTSSTAYGGSAFYFLAINSGGSPLDYFGGTIGCDGVGASMTQAQWMQMMTDLQTIKQISGN